MLLLDRMRPNPQQRGDKGRTWYDLHREYLAILAHKARTRG